MVTYHAVEAMLHLLNYLVATMLPVSNWLSVAREVMYSLEVWRVGCDVGALGAFYRRGSRAIHSCR